MTITTNEHGAIFVDGQTDADVVGWVRNEGCANRNCLAAIEAGRPWHAIPRTGLLPDYHFATRDEANAALTPHVHRIVDEDTDECECGQLLCPDTGTPVAYSSDGPVSYWHLDGSTCFLHQHAVTP